jgi:hypothetical protein
MFGLILYMYTALNVKKYLKIIDKVETQGWPWARARWATALGLTSKLGLIPKFFKAFIERIQYIYIYKN